MYLTNNPFRDYLFLGHNINNYFMENLVHDLILKAYKGFNSRDIDTTLATFHKDVQWPKAFEGGYVEGHDEIRAYWTRQWSEINGVVEPLHISELSDGRFAVKVHQFVKDLEGKILFDDTIKHIYTIKENLLLRMDIELS